MKFRGTTLGISVAALIVTAAFVEPKDRDEYDLIAIEQAFCEHANPGPEEAADMEKYLYDGRLNQLTPLGQLRTVTRVQVVEISSKPDPADPNVRSSTSASDFHVDVYGDTALVSYKMTNTDRGHKDPALNATEHFGCLDTFVKRSGRWYEIGSACAPSAPLPNAEWNRVKGGTAD